MSGFETRLTHDPRDVVPLEQRQRLIARARRQHREHPLEVEAERVEVIGLVIDDEARITLEVVHAGAGVRLPTPAHAQEEKGTLPSRAAASSRCLSLIHISEPTRLLS